MQTSHLQIWKRSVIETIQLVNLHNNLVNVIGYKYHMRVSQRLRLFQECLFQANRGENPNKSFLYI